MADNTTSPFVLNDEVLTNTIPAYLIIWILLCLASNSMAQPSGRICGASTRYRLYLCSSPFLCLADGIAILVRLLATSTYLQISPLKASRLAILSRADERHHYKRNKDIFFDDPMLSTAHENSFFLIGTVPAAIHLASFSGVPGTQTLGLMFVVSFATIEFVTLLSIWENKHGTIPEVLKPRSSLSRNNRFASKPSN